MVPWLERERFAQRRATCRHLWKPTCTRKNPAHFSARYCCLIKLHERTSGQDQEIALTWGYDADTGNYWHNGATSGFTANVFFNPRMDAAVVVLRNTLNPLLSADEVAEHIRQRLQGENAISLDSVPYP